MTGRPTLAYGTSIPMRAPAGAPTDIVWETRCGEVWAHRGAACGRGTSASKALADLERRTSLAARLFGGVR